MAIIHLLDDDIAVTQACAFLLESLGYEVSCWEQGEKFLAEANLHGGCTAAGYAYAGTGWARCA